ncbi:hypothetical protein D8674_013473 [Pyrus ussuriensis x Pyrus communis]|uniref:PB1-like domain-containing protein n=1 Tax=Pyrus ussuriensis x Pyrus communis TaxID=2448454 RepID=A0A5N5H3C8_9ROSA|nr:hypothetical protein D8674_013473 [Pyrus ussuriensis x Pyrus communis]
MRCRWVAGKVNVIDGKGNHDLFTLDIHHGGHFKAGQYVDGIVQWVDNYTKDYMSMLDLYEAATVLGYNKDIADVFQWVSLISLQVRLHLLYLVDLRKITNNLGSDSCTASFVDVDIQFEGFNADDEYEENKSVEIVRDTIERIDEEVTDSEKEEDDDGVTLKFKDSNYEQSEEDDDKGAKNHKELGEISTKEYNSEDLDSVRFESEEHKANVRVRRRLKTPKLPQYRLEFPNMKQSKEVVRAYGVSVCLSLDWAMNDSNRLRIKCLGKAAVPCQWKWYASFVRKGPIVRIKTLVLQTYNPEHICVKEEHSKFTTSSWLADRFNEEVRLKSDMSVTGFMELERKHYGIDITKNQVYKAKRIAKKVTEGSIDEQYAKLWDYLEESKVTNPRSTIKVKTDFQGENPIFKRL